MKQNIPLEKKQDVQHLKETLRQKQAAVAEKYTQLGKTIIELVEKEDKAINHLVDEIVAIKTKIACNEVAKANHPPLSKKEEP